MLALLLDKKLSTDDSYAATATQRQQLPTARVKEGALIGALRQASAMTDVSDGLAADLGHVCEKSGVVPGWRRRAFPCAEPGSCPGGARG